MATYTQKIIIGRFNMENSKELTKDILYDLYINQGMLRSQIADIYGISKSKVSYLLSKYDIKLYKKRIEDSLLELRQNMGEDEFNKAMLKILRIDKLFTLEDISKALAHYCFRNGHIEYMHSNGQLSEKDMKTLNIFCYNKILTFFKLIIDNDKEKLFEIIKYNSLCGSGWNPPEFDV